MTLRNASGPRAETLLLIPLALCLAAPMGAMPAQERDRARTFEALVRRFDLDLDGRISRDEFPRGDRAFRRLDRDRDGVLTKGDFALEEERSEPARAAAPDREATAEEVEFFETKIRPVLADSCYSCHSDTASKIRGGLRVDSLEALLAGGASGAALVPGDPEASPLIEAVRYDDPAFAMPPREPLADEEIRDLERWVAMGAPWPKERARAGSDTEVVDVAGGESLNREIDFEQGRTFWAFQPPVRPALPSALDDDWAWSEIDRFLRAAMTEAGVEPVRDADRRTWLRRVTFDLTGLPPTPEALEAFEEDRAAGAYETVVDRLLASEAYGERFGRHWLDVARYGESSGKESNVVYPHAWRYRDFVIDSMNEDVPYDEFLTKQIAGDLLEYAGPDERAENLIATGYLALGSKSHNNRDQRQFSLDMVDEQIDAVSQGMLGLTLACARCHDHKFDPIPTEDYYALAGIFLSTETRYGTRRSPGNNHASELIELPEGADVPNGPAMEPYLRQLIERGRERLDQQASAMDEMSMSDARMDPKSGEDARQAAFRARTQKQQLELLEELLSRFDERGRAKASNRLAMGALEGTPRDIAVLERGELDRPGDVVERGFPRVLRAGDGPTIEDGSGRLELARWIASEDNPLTARVWVNRIWLHLFGSGIVTTPDNFGAGGQAPDHPELLDWLALELIENGWSTKSIVREIVLSHAYRLDSAHDVSNARHDPDVVTLWRMPDRRLEAEAIRDALLFVAGELDETPPVGSPTGAMEGALRQEAFTSYLTRERSVRSVYLPSVRGHMVGALDVFDAPDAAFVTGDREETNVATQALFMMNDADVLRLADAFADRLLASEGSDRKRIQLAFELALGRGPTSTESGAVAQFLRNYERMVPERTAEDERDDRRRGRARRGRQRGLAVPELAPQRSPEHAAWSAFAQSLFQSAEFRAIG